MRAVENVACSNMAGFVMNFSIRWLDGSGKWNTSEWNSGNYPIDQSRTCNLRKDAKIPDDAVAVAPYVHAILGKHEEGNPLVSSASNGQTATYEVKGTTLDYSVKLL